MELDTTKKWGCREEDIREIEQLLGYIHEDGQAMEDKLHERKDEVEELKKEIKELEFYLANAQSSADR